jgi:2-oxoglutarate ferredoxin oxidoreductase subunit beta
MMNEITTSYEAGDVNDLVMHDGSTIRLHKLAKGWDPLDRYSAMNAMHRARQNGEILTGLLYMDRNSSDLHELIRTSNQALNSLGESDLCPGSEVLAKINAGLR